MTMNKQVFLLLLFCAATIHSLMGQAPAFTSQPPTPLAASSSAANHATPSSPSPATVPPGSAPYWQQEVNYSIDVTLNDSDRTIDGFVTMDYINHSPDTLTY